MSNNEIEETHPIEREPSGSTSSITQPVEPNLDATTPIGPTPKPPKSRRGLWIALGIVSVLILGAVGGWLGYQAAIQIRLQKQANQIAMVATTQFQLGLVDLENARYDTARQRFEYIIQLDPNFPGATEKLTEVMLAMAKQTTPTPSPTMTVQPTADMRGVEQIFASAQQMMRNQDWYGAIDTLNALRAEDATYRAIDVDGMYYIILRFRGMDKIINKGNLEGGMYDLALAEKFAPLDKDADSYRSWARSYLTGASFWGIDWAQVVSAFSQVYTSLPNLRDGSGYTAAERFRIASIKYGDQLAEKGEYCMARDQYRSALAMGDDSSVAPAATKVQLECEPPTKTPKPTSDAVEEETPVPEETTPSEDPGTTDETATE